MNHETLSIKHSRSQRMQPFPIFIAALHSIYSVVCMAKADTVLLFPLFFFLLPLLLEWGCWCECNFWYTLEVAGEFGPAAPRLCSTLNWGFSSNSLSCRTVMLNERTCSEQEGSTATFTRNDGSIILFFFSSAETLIISQTANMGDVRVQAPRVYLSSRLHSGNLTRNYFDELWENQLKVKMLKNNCVNLFILGRENPENCEKRK